MTTDKKKQLKARIFEILLFDGVAVGDPGNGDSSPDKIVALFDELLYENAGKDRTVPYEVCRRIYKEWHSHPRFYTLQELSDECRVPLSTVYKITRGEFWPM